MLRLETAGGLGQDFAEIPGNPLVFVTALRCSDLCTRPTWHCHDASDRIWLVSFIDYDLGYFDDETCRLEPIANPFSPKVLPMSPE